MRSQDRKYLINLLSVDLDPKGRESLRLAIFDKLQHWGVDPAGTLDISGSDRRINASFSTGCRIVQSVLHPREILPPKKPHKNHPALLQRHETRLKEWQAARERAADDVAFVQAIAAMLGLPPVIDPPLQDAVAGDAVVDSGTDVTSSDEPNVTDDTAAVEADERLLKDVIGVFEARCFESESIDGEPVVTVGQLRRWIAAGNAIIDAVGIGPVKAAKIAEQIS